MIDFSAPNPVALPSDGSNQGQRNLAALAPGYVAVDERSVADYLDFALAYSGEVVFFGADNQPGGDWSGLLNPTGLSVQDWAAQRDQFLQWLANPDPTAPISAFGQPHRLLFAAYLNLLQSGQQSLNQLSQRHLDFYYRDFLRLSMRPGIADSVNVLVTLASGVSEALLPAHTLLAAGKDSTGKALRYATTADLLVTAARIAQLSSVYVNRAVVGIKDARERCTKTANDALLAMLAIAYGVPNPGDPLPLYPVPVYPTTWQTGDLATIGKTFLPANTVDVPFLQNLLELTQFVGNTLYLEFDELSQLMALKDRQSADNPQAIADWNAINGTYLTAAGVCRMKPEAFSLNVANAMDFTTNLNQALGGPPDFSTLSEVNSITDLYDRRTDPAVQAYIPTHIYLSPDQFNEMMQIKVAIDADWQEINNLLIRAGQRRNAAWKPNKWATSPPNFASNMQDALGVVSFAKFDNMGLGTIGNLDQFYVALQFLQGYFFDSAENFQALMETWGNAAATKEDWTPIYANLQAAYVNRVQAERSAQLSAIQQSGVPQQTALGAMLALALGQSVSESETVLLEQLSLYVATTSPDYLQIQQAMATSAPPLGDQWPQVVATLALAWRNRIGVDPVPQQVTWAWLFGNADATAVQAAADGDAPRWRTFGQQPAPAQGPPLASPLGLVLASPVLCLSQGARTLKLVLGFDANTVDLTALGACLADPTRYPLQVQVSTANGWITPDNLAIALDSYPGTAQPGTTLQGVSLSFCLSATAVALAAPAGADCPWPQVRLLLTAVWQDSNQGGSYVLPYPLFDSLALERVWLAVGVKGLQGLQMENDESSVDSSKPFAPFGAASGAGSGLNFAHSELAVKRIDKMTLNLQWMKVPAKMLPAYYANYPAITPTADNSVFTATFSLIDLSVPHTLAPTVGLFSPKDATAAWPVAVEVASTLAPTFAYLPDTAACDYANPAAWRRYWRLELNAPDFQQDAYPVAASAASIRMAADIAAAKNPLNNASYQVNPPYSPRLKTFSVDYQASVEVVMSEYGGGPERLYWQMPLSGYAEVRADANGVFRILPDYGNEGELYIGLQGVAAPQTVSLLLQLADGSADPDLAPQPVAWSYLSGNQWCSLQQGQVLADGTQGFTGPGILQLQLPQALPNTLLPGGLYWLRAAVAQGCDSLCDAVAIQAQAVCATWVDAGNAADHLDQSLPALSITQTASPVAGIAGISQPYTSFGGQPAEDPDRFQTRAGERLRHKGRALTYWDYEQLILSQFAEIYTAKCIAGPAVAGSPGQVTVVVVPDIRNRLPFNPFAPKASAGLLLRIQNYLAGCLPPLAQVVVKNPYYVAVRVRFAVRFMPGCDPGYYRPQLNDELNRFLSPWAYDGSSEVSIGGKIFANNIIDFLQRRGYVDYVAEVKLFKSEDGSTFQLVEDPDSASAQPGYSVQADRPDGVLVSALSHDIDLITENDFAQEDLAGIGYMKVDLDFVVG